MEPRRGTPREKKGLFLCGQPNSLLVPSVFRFQTKVFAPLAFFGVCGDFGAFSALACLPLRAHRGGKDVMYRQAGTGAGTTQNQKSEFLGRTTFKWIHPGQSPASHIRTRMPSSLV
jgi:hypothetical protein